MLSSVEFARRHGVVEPAGETFRASIARTAYEEAGIGPEGLSLAEVHDLSTVLELQWYEDLGLCARGEAAKLLREGSTTLGGRIPSTSVVGRSPSEWRFRRRRSPRCAN